jgi:hypothetical protein
VVFEVKNKPPMAYIMKGRTRPSPTLGVWCFPILCMVSRVQTNLYIRPCDYQLPPAALTCACDSTHAPSNPLSSPPPGRKATPPCAAHLGHAHPTSACHPPSRLHPPQPHLLMSSVTVSFLNQKWSSFFRGDVQEVRASRTHRRHTSP